MHDDTTYEYDMNIIELGEGTDASHQQQRHSYIIISPDCLKCGDGVGVSFDLAGFYDGDCHEKWSNMNKCLPDICSTPTDEFIIWMVESSFH